jgi:hypothetical protein
LITSPDSVNFDLLSASSKSLNSDVLAFAKEVHRANVKPAELFGGGTNAF